MLDGEGAPVGTCFQLKAGVLVTAWHVLDEIGAAAEGAQVRIDPLAGGAAFDAAVARMDPLRDLAVLTSATGLPTVAGSLTATDQIPLRVKVTVTGHVVPDDPGHTYRFLDAPGEWAGGTTRDDAVPLGRMTSTAVVPGMSGAPVIRNSDGAVAGVVSGRYNSTDGWLADTVWVARTEDLAVLLDGIAEVPLKRAPLAGPVDLLLIVTGGRVQLTGAGIEVAASHGGVPPGLAEAVNEMRRTRARAGLLLRSETEAPVAAGELPLGRAARLLAESFLPEPVADELGGLLAAAEQAHQPVRLGLAVPPNLAGLPWEALPRPDGRGPLALHPLVSMYRKAGAAEGRVLPGPLRIVVAIAAPDTGGGPVLDYERELRNVLAAVRAARTHAADVRVVPFATVAAIRAELDRGLAHVLHITGHGSPGTLALEDEDGSSRPVTADEFADQAIPAGQMPPVVVLSACYTDTAGIQGRTSFAARLCRRGAAAVIATETSITDRYATRLLARVYGALAQASHPDTISALAGARRQVQAELETSPDRRDNELAGLGEWAAVTVLAAAGSVPVLDPGRTAPPTRQPSRLHIAGLAAREDWYFVGRRREQRHWPADLTESTLAGIVIHGIGGTGKTTLAAEITTRVRHKEPSRVLITLTGSLTLETLLGAVISAIRRELLISGQDAAAIRALDIAARADLAWQDRLAILRSHVLDHVPVLLLLDNFEDNLRPDGDAGYAVRDEVLAGLLAAWVADPGLTRLLVTCRYLFTLPGGVEQGLSFRQLGPLSRAETMKLAWSLPALDRLDEGQLEQAWRLAGGHPRSLEYLDALLSGGTARYPDVTARLAAAVTRRLSGDDRSQWLAARTGLAAALAETVALAADDVLLGDLLARLAAVPGAAGLLLGVSVYREPVDRNAVLFVAGQPDPDAEHIPDRQATYAQITGILAAAGITMEERLDLASVPADVRTQLAPYVAELNRQPVPPFRPVPGLNEQVAACQVASLLTVSEEGGEPRFFVHQWTATELARRAAREPGQRLAAAHQQAAAYWQWRVRVWPQDKAADLHDLLEARHHLLHTRDVEGVGRVTARICDQLQTWGAWDQEVSLINDTIPRLPADSPQRAMWITGLANVAHFRGDYDEAERQYRRALDIDEHLGDQAGMAAAHHNLGVLAQDRGDYDEAARQYQRALDIKAQLDDQAGTATTYHQLGILAQRRWDHDEAARQYQRALDIRERLGDQEGMARSYFQLGVLAHDRGQYDEAARQYQRALDIRERLGDQYEMASTYHQLGILANDRGDYDEAARQYQRALDIRERLGQQSGMAATYHQLGNYAYLRGDHDEAARQYQRALDIFERLGDQAGMAATYHQLGVLAQERGEYDEADRLYQRALDIKRRLGNEDGIARSYHQLGTLANDRGDYDEAVRLIKRALDMFERLGDQEGLANSCAQLGGLARDRGDYDEAIRLYQRSLDIRERLGDQAGGAIGCSQLGILEKERGGSATVAVTWHVKALAIRLRLGVPQAEIDLRHLAAHRRELGAGPFTRLLAQAADSTDLAEVITSLLDRVDETDGGTA
jgi:tetratricopeptide (TPR) repeat protein